MEPNLVFAYIYQNSYDKAEEQSKGLSRVEESLKVLGLQRM